VTPKELQFPKAVARFIDRYRAGFTTTPPCPDTLEHLPPHGQEQPPRKKWQSWPTYQAYLKDQAARQPDAAPYRYYRCPCGGTDHVASRCKHPEGQVGDGYADVLHCYETGKQWFVGGYRLVGETNLQRCKRIIRDEELKYIAHLEGRPKLSSASYDTAGLNARSKSRANIWRSCGQRTVSSPTWSRRTLRCPAVFRNLYTKIACAPESERRPQREQNIIDGAAHEFWKLPIRALVSRSCGTEERRGSCGGVEEPTATHDRRSSIRGPNRGHRCSPGHVDLPRPSGTL
jgi:hypothetical protein